ncbi:hypothetical protein MKZ38_003722 [Zalerion maritima]|uniref:Uncharacterized protein n=1 Tax=Zalerion maritima TaxID=339359 RepID=A0AAD5WXJ5_9PEZI|nr:hypothetical protein MKZ38_003722 [Zalerion maritima]
MSGSESADDPLGWGVERVVQELCTPNCSWRVPGAVNLPEPAQLADLIRENEIGGEELLTCEENLGGLDNLFNALKIRKFREKNFLGKLIQHFKKTSKQYQLWKDGESQDVVMENTLSARASSDKGFHTPEAEAKPLAEPANDSIKPTKKHTPEPPTSPLGPPKNPADPILKRSAVDAFDFPRLELASPPENPSPKKRKRIAPTNMQSEPMHEHAPSIPSFLSRLEDRGDDPLSRLLPDSASNGEDGELTGPLLPMLDNDFQNMDFEFSFIARPTTAIRKEAVSRAMKHQFTSVAKKSGYESGSGSEDELLPAWGQSDDEYDDETWEEIEQERLEIGRRKSKFLSNEKVGAAIEEACNAFIQNWRENKLPRLEPTAYKIWSAGRRRGPNRSDDMAVLVKSKDSYEHRLLKLKRHIHDSQWKSAEEVKKQAAAAEFTVMDLEDVRWRLGVLLSPHSPPKPLRSSPSRPVAKKSKQAELDSGEDAISSGDDDDDFIVQDSHGEVCVFAEEPPRRRAAPRGSPTKAKAPTTPAARRPSALPIDLTRDDGEVVGNPPVDLTGLPDTPPAEASTSKPEPDNVLVLRPPGVKLTQLEWNTLEFGDRLILKMMSVWEDAVREALFESKRNHNEDELWHDYVAPTIRSRQVDGNPNVHQQVATSWVRFFDAFLRREKVKRRKFKLFDKIAIRTKTVCKEHHKEWPQFLDLFGKRMELIETKVVSIISDESDMDLDTPSKRNKPIILDKNAVDIRKASALLRRTQEERKRTNRELLSLLPAAQRRLIINETKAESDGCIYVNDNIAKLIKDHQVEGIRFLWNQVVADKEQQAKPQGCLLAHTMGLGKTMQVITLLIAIQEARSSEDESVSRQIPEHLSRSQTLVLCPPTLVENWMCELDKWDEDNILGRHFPLTAQTNTLERQAIINQWNSGGGVLIMGYSLFRSIFAPRKAILESDRIRVEGLQKILTKESRIVVADEAHLLKNEQSQISKACSNFHTGSRIALTGSPLSNNVLEYYSMINWVATNYLGPRREFKDLYAKPIQDGLYQDSTSYDKRRSLKKLKILTEVVASKVHRRTTAVLKGCLPSKQEFVFFVPLTQRQREVYEYYINGAKNNLHRTYGAQRVSATEIMSLVNALGLICNHPKIYHNKLKCTQNESTAATKPKANPDSEGNTPPAEGDAENIDGDQVANLSREFIEGALASFPAKDLDSVEHSWKVKLLLKIVKESRDIGDKVLVFSQSVHTLEFLQALLRHEQIECQLLDGKTPMQKRQGNVDDFNKSESSTTYLISTKAGGLGLNIHGANRVVIFDFLWNPSEESQALGRAYRIGQKKPVTIYRFVSAGTFEEKKLNHVIFKLQLFSRVVDKAKPFAFAQKIALDLLDPIKDVEAKDVTSFRDKDVVLDRILDEDTHKVGIKRIMPFDSIYEEDVDEALDEQEQEEVKKELQSLKERQKDPNWVPPGHSSQLSRTLATHVAGQRPSGPSSQRHSHTSSNSQPSPNQPPYSPFSGQLPNLRNAYANGNLLGQHSPGAQAHQQGRVSPATVNAKVDMAAPGPQVLHDSEPVPPILTNASSNMPQTPRAGVPHLPSSAPAADVDNSASELGRQIVGRLQQKYPSIKDGSLERFKADMETLKDVVPPLQLRSFLRTALDTATQTPYLAYKVIFLEPHLKQLAGQGSSGIQAALAALRDGAAGTSRSNQSNTATPVPDPKPLPTWAQKAVQIGGRPHQSPRGRPPGQSRGRPRRSPSR